MSKNSPVLPTPQSWSLKTWKEQAPHVWPGDGTRARMLVRLHRAELTSFGALTRIGRELVFIGVGYQKWLASNTSRVPGYEVPMNTQEHADKRFDHGQRRGRRQVASG
jgi:hypothetical protein